MKRIYINEDVCMGCHLCEVYCSLAHSQSRDLIKALKNNSLKPIPRMRIEKQGPLTFSVRCQQCEEATCVSACLSGALSKDDISGMVLVDSEKCMGCWTCIIMCPYGAIKQDVIDSCIVKCDYCKEEEELACVSHCPNEALVCEDITGEKIPIGQ